MQRRPRAELRRPGPIPCWRRSRVWHPRLMQMGGRLELSSLWRTRRSYHRELPTDCRRTLQACSTDESILFLTRPVPSSLGTARHRQNFACNKSVEYNEGHDGVRHILRAASLGEQGAGRYLLKLCLVIRRVTLELQRG